MKYFLFTVAFLFAVVTNAFGQNSVMSPTPPKAEKPELVIVTPQDEVEPTINDPVPDLNSIRSLIPYKRPDSKTRFKRYVNGMFGPVALGKTVVSAGYGTWRNSPEEWGDKWEGFGRRVASSLGKSVIKQTTTYGLDEAFKLDSHYYRSEKKDFGSKLSNALLSTVTARNAKGKKVFGFPRIAGTYTSSIIAAEVWYPARYDWKDGVKSGTVSLGLNAAFNVFKEFVWKK
jgi:hypothetical protein